MKIKPSTLKSILKKLVTEELSNSGGNDAQAESVATSTWGSVYNVMPHGEAKNNKFYRVTLNNDSGPVKYLKQDAHGKWYRMDPPEQVWRLVPQSQDTVVSEYKSDINKDPMDGNVDDLKTMDTANLGEDVLDGEIKEMTSSGAVFSGGPTIQTPHAFSKKGSGSKRAMDVTKKMGYKPAKKEY